MESNHTRMKRESKTIETMVGMYCRGNHQQKGALCQDCRELLEYSRDRLEKCPFQVNKPTCSKCPVHCYKPVMRRKIREVMRYAGPRMVYSHPCMAWFHFLDGRKSVPKKRKQHEGIK